MPACATTAWDTGAASRPRTGAAPMRMSCRSPARPSRGGGKDESAPAAGASRTPTSLARLKEALSHPIDPLYRLIQTPTLVLTGEKDLVTPPSCSEKVAQLLKEAANADVTALVL